MSAPPPPYNSSHRHRAPPPLPSIGLPSTGLPSIPDGLLSGCSLQRDLSASQSPSPIPPSSSKSYASIRCPPPLLRPPPPPLPLRNVLRPPPPPPPPPPIPPSTVTPPISVLPYQGSGQIFPQVIPSNDLAQHKANYRSGNSQGSLTTSYDPFLTVSNAMLDSSRPTSGRMETFSSPSAPRTPTHPQAPLPSEIGSPGNYSSEVNHTVSRTRHPGMDLKSAGSTPIMQPLQLQPALSQALHKQQHTTLASQPHVLKIPSPQSHHKHQDSAKALLLHYQQPEPAAFQNSQHHSMVAQDGKESEKHVILGEKREEPDYDHNAVRNDSSWECSACTYRNLSTTEVCDICGYEPVVPSAPSVSQSFYSAAPTTMHANSCEDAASAVNLVHNEDTTKPPVMYTTTQLTKRGVKEQKVAHNPNLERKSHLNPNLALALIVVTALIRYL